MQYQLLLIFVLFFYLSIGMRLATRKDIFGVSIISDTNQYVQTKMLNYHKVPKFSDARKRCCNLPKIQEKMPNLWVFLRKEANGIANSEDPDQTANSEDPDQTAPIGAV